MSEPHFVRDYNRLVHRLIAAEPNYEAAMSRAVGDGSYVEIGLRNRRILKSLGLQDSHYLIDVGAGSGRVAFSLRDLPHLRYLGTDVVPELLDFARKKCGREDWAFKQVDSIEIPEKDCTADFIVFFSVFTHLTEAEGYQYLQEAKRVIKKDGAIVVSFLDPDISLHAKIVGKSWLYWSWWKQRLARWLGRGTLNQLLSKKVLNNWSEKLNLSTEYADEAIGQSVCIFRERQSLTA